MAWAVKPIARRSRGSASPTVSVRDPPSRILIRAIQEVLQGPVEPDREHRRAQRLEIFREETLPEVFPQAEQEHRGADRDDVALEPEVVRETGGAAANGVHPPRDSVLG